MGCGWVGGFMTIMPRCGSILQAETCQILRLAEIQDGAECGNKQVLRQRGMNVLLVYLGESIFLRVEQIENC